MGTPEVSHTGPPACAFPSPRQDGRIEELRLEIAGCRLCTQAGFAVHSAPIISFAPGAAVMTVGQSPGRHEAAVTGLPFSGPAGRRLFGWLAAAGFREAEFRASQAMTAITLCFPGSHPSGRGDRVPSRAEQALCAPWLDRLLAILEPRWVLPIGGLAIQRFLGRGHTLTECIGECYQVNGRIVIPLPHPSGASLWFNDRANQERFQRALAHLAALRQALSEGGLLLNSPEDRCSDVLLGAATPQSTGGAGRADYR